MLNVERSPPAMTTTTTIPATPTSDTIRPPGLFAQIAEDWVAHGRDWTRPGFRAVAKSRGAVNIGDGATVGANAVVVKDVPAGAIAVGIPAQIILGRRERGPSGQ